MKGNAYVPFMLRRGDGSTLSLDFTTGVLDSRLTFSRASGGTYVGNNGLVYGVDFATSSSLAIGTGSKSVTLTATAGTSRRYEIGQTVYIANGANNMSGAVTAYSASTQVLTINATSTSGTGSFTSWIVGNASARFDYDPTTLAPKGLLIEGTATNYVTNSQNITTGTWTIGANTALTTNTTDVTDPAGGNTATKIALSANLYCSRAQAVTVQQNTAYTFSFWICGTAGSQQRIFESGGTDLVSQTTFTYTNTGWTRVQVQFTSATRTTLFVYVCSKSTSASSSDVLYVWGAQLETGSGASSYIPTGTSSVQRASEVMYMDGTNFSAWWPSGQSEYSVYFAGDITRTPATTQVMWLARTGSGGTGTSLASHFVTTANSIRANNTINDLNSGLTATVGTRFRSAFAVKSGDSALYVNNGSTTASVTASDTGLATTAAQIVFNPNSDVFQHIAALKFWPTRLPNATLQSLTA